MTRLLGLKIKQAPKIGPKTDTQCSVFSCYLVENSLLLGCIVSEQRLGVLPDIKTPFLWKASMLKRQGVSTGLDVLI